LWLRAPLCDSAFLLQRHKPRETPASCPVGFVAAFGPWRLRYAGDGSGAGPTGTSAPCSLMASSITPPYFLKKVAIFAKKSHAPPSVVAHQSRAGRGALTMEGRLNWGLMFELDAALDQRIERLPPGLRPSGVDPSRPSWRLTTIRFVRRDLYVHRPPCTAQANEAC
jgi:hypothetical protein